MNSRQHRAAFEAKRTLPDFTDEQCIAIDDAYDEAKTDPVAWDQKIHALHSDEVRMMRILGGAL